MKEKSNLSVCILWLGLVANNTVSDFNFWIGVLQVLHSWYLILFLISEGQYRCIEDVKYLFAYPKSKGKIC